MQLQNDYMFRATLLYASLKGVFGKPKISKDVSLLGIHLHIEWQVSHKISLYINTSPLMDVWGLFIVINNTLVANELLRNIQGRGILYCKTWDLYFNFKDLISNIDKFCISI